MMPREGSSILKLKYELCIAAASFDSFLHGFRYTIHEIVFSCCNSKNVSDSVKIESSDLSDSNGTWRFSILYFQQRRGHGNVWNEDDCSDLKTYLHNFIERRFTADTIYIGDPAGEVIIGCQWADSGEAGVAGPGSESP